MMTDLNNTLSMQARTEIFSMQQRLLARLFNSYYERFQDVATQIQEQGSTLSAQLDQYTAQRTEQINIIDTYIQNVHRYAEERYELSETTIKIASRDRFPIANTYPEDWFRSVYSYSNSRDLKYAEQLVSQVEQESFEDWRKLADQTIHEVKEVRIPIFSSNRNRRIEDLKREIGKFIARSYSLKAWLSYEMLSFVPRQLQSWNTASSEQIAALMTEEAKNTTDDQSLLQELKPSWMQDKIINPAPGKPIVTFGNLFHTGLSGTRVLPGYSDTFDWTITTSAGKDSYFQSYLYLDLDRCGGIVTDDPTVIQIGILELLSLLPAGRVVIDAFDPEQLGESLSFLFGLGDEGEAIYGNTVRTNSDDLNQLLQQTEQHIAFVTQKYLQNKHNNITEYNIEAGEIAEPYRILVLYDFPGGFTNAFNKLKQDLIARITRISNIGRRAGVFVFVLAKEDPQTFRSLPWLPRQGVPRLPEACWDYLPLSYDTTGCETNLELTWIFKSFNAPEDDQLKSVLQTIRRSLKNAKSTRVAPSFVATLANRIIQADYDLGLHNGEYVADPNNPMSWWHGDSNHKVTSVFGRMGASGVAQLTFDSKDSSSGLIGGRTGTGKSVLLHAIIASLVTQYSPNELELYLIDLKEGVEFEPYARHELPHARVVAIESNREFAISVLESLEAEITHRGELFKSLGSNPDVSSYRENSGEALPRIVLVIDEFQILFSKDNQALSARATTLLEKIIKQGRAFGIHVLLSSQTLSGSASALSPIIGQIKNRMVLSSTASDSQLLLSADNTDAQLLTKAGEGILNTKAGLKDANTRFQATYWSAEDRADLVTALAEKAQAAGITKTPVIFEGNRAAKLTREVLNRLHNPNPQRQPLLPVGAPMSLADPVSGKLTRNPGSNAIIITENHLATIGIFAAALCTQKIATTMVNFIHDDNDWTAKLARIEEAGLAVVAPGELSKTLDMFLSEALRRVEDDLYSLQPRVLLLAGAQRAKRITPADSTAHTDAPNQVEGLSLYEKLHKLLQLGPEVGIHVVMSFDFLGSARKRLGEQDWKEISLRIIGSMSEKDSNYLIDTPEASKLKSNMLIFEDQDSAITATVRSYELPPAQELDKLLGQA